MAFDGTKFVKTSMSESVSAFLIGDYQQRFTPEELIETLCSSHWKVSLRYMNNDGSWIFSCTTSPDHKHPGLCISLWGNSFEHVTKKVEAVLSLMDSLGENPLSIERRIKETETAIAQLVKENLDKLNLR